MQSMSLVSMVRTPGREPPCTGSRGRRQGIARRGGALCIGLLVASAACAQSPTTPSTVPAPPRMSPSPVIQPAPSSIASSTAVRSGLPNTGAAARPPSLPNGCEPTRTLAAGVAARVAPPGGSASPGDSSDRKPGVAPGAGNRNEPAVECIVIDEDANRIEELRVRGQTQRIVVRPKDGGAPYEIQMLDAGRDPSAKSGPGRGGAGQRVWPVLAF